MQQELNEGLLTTGVRMVPVEAVVLDELQTANARGHLVYLVEELAEGAEGPPRMTCVALRSPEEGGADALRSLWKRAELMEAGIDVKLNDASWAELQKKADAAVICEEVDAGAKLRADFEKEYDSLANELNKRKQRDNENTMLAAAVHFVVFAVFTTPAIAVLVADLVLACGYAFKLLRNWGLNDIVADMLRTKDMCKFNTDVKETTVAYRDSLDRRREMQRARWEVTLEHARKDQWF